MYEELIEELRRHHCDAKEDDTQEVCEECAYDVIIADKSVPSGIASVCVCGLMNRAADAIEELSAKVSSIEMKQQQQRKPQTNADRIRSMSDEELAEFLKSIVQSMSLPIACILPNTFVESWLDWLKQDE